MTCQTVAVISGAASGIGRAVCQELLKDESVTVAGIDLAWPDADLPERLLPLVADITDAEAVAQAFRDVDQHCPGELRYLVCAAGAQRRLPSLTVSADAWHGMLALHLDGSLFACQQAAARMNNGGSIVLFSSVAEFFGFPERTPYAVAKAGVSAMARCLAVEWSTQGIRVNSVAPGYVDTPLLAAAMKRGDLSFDPASLHSMQRLASAEEIAKPVRFLLSEDASFVTGETLVVDGGYRIFKAR